MVGLANWTSQAQLQAGDVPWLMQGATSAVNSGLGGLKDGITGLYGQLKDQQDGKDMAGLLQGAHTFDDIQNRIADRPGLFAGLGAQYQNNVLNYQKGMDTHALNTAQIGQADASTRAEDSRTALQNQEFGHNPDKWAQETKQSNASINASQAAAYAEMQRAKNEGIMGQQNLYNLSRLMRDGGAQDRATEAVYGNGSGIIPGLQSPQTQQPQTTIPAASGVPTSDFQMPSMLSSAGGGSVASQSATTNHNPYMSNPVPSAQSVFGTGTQNDSANASKSMIEQAYKQQLTAPKNQGSNQPSGMSQAAQNLTPKERMAMIYNNVKDPFVRAHLPAAYKAAYDEWNSGTPDNWDNHPFDGTDDKAFSATPIDTAEDRAKLGRAQEAQQYMHGVVKPQLDDRTVLLNAGNTNAPREQFMLDNAKNGVQEQDMQEGELAYPGNLNMARAAAIAAAKLRRTGQDTAQIRANIPKVLDAAGIRPMRVRNNLGQELNAQGLTMEQHNTKSPGVPFIPAEANGGIESDENSNIAKLQKQYEAMQAQIIHWEEARAHANTAHTIHQQFKDFGPLSNEVLQNAENFDLKGGKQAALNDIMNSSVALKALAAGAKPLYPWGYNNNSFHNQVEMLHSAQQQPVNPYASDTTMLWQQVQQARKREEAARITQGNIQRAREASKKAETVKPATPARGE